MGTTDEGRERGETVCSYDLGAVEADPPIYVVQAITEPDGCVTGSSIRLTHDPGAGTLTVEWLNVEGNAFGSGVLTPGTDPGPKP